MTRPGQHIHASTQNLENNHEMYPRNMLWINPADAGAIQTGDEVKVENQFGRSIRLEAWITSRIMPGVVCVPHGFGHYSKLLTVALGKGSDGGASGELIEPFTIAQAVANGDPAQGSQMQDVYVKVTKA
ncbi:MAG: hypothetical protein M5U22_20805 [Thermoleophilia bacterium]|nr:hypothetical protein [Thermoleophilia bacterium]